MNFLNNIKSSIVNKEYFIGIMANGIYFYNYKEIECLNNDYLSVIFSSFIVAVKGTDFKLTKMINNELIVSGNIKSIEYVQ